MASFVVNSAAKQVGALLVNEAKNLYAVSENIERLQNELEWMQCFLEDADNRQHREKVLRKWVAESRDFAYEAEDIIERYLHEISYPRKKGILNTIKWSCFFLGDALTLREIGSSIDNLRTRISYMTSKLQVYGVQVIKQSDSLTYNSIKELRRTYHHDNEDPAIGLERHLKAVMERLINIHESKVVGITGMGGLGKTTLAKKVCAEEKVQEHFDKRVWIFISKDFDPSHVFRDILSQLGENGENPEMICKALHEKKCLVVLDDIWDIDAWEKLRPAFTSNDRTGSKILITTRKLELVPHADPLGYFQYSLEVLSDEDSWKLLQTKAFFGEITDEGVRHEMEKLGRDMLKSCEGLPLAIVALGGILASRRTIDGWKTALKGITSYLMNKGRQSGIDKFRSVLELSYDELPVYLKPCFLYFGCFPKDIDISAQRLYHLWEAEGIVAVSIDDMEDIEGVSLDDIAKSYLSELVNRNMVQVEKTWKNKEVKTCRLHDVMRDMCLEKCKEANFLKLMKLGRFKELSSYSRGKLRRCVLDLADGVVADSPFPEHLNETPCIRSLLVFSHISSSAGKLLSVNNGKFLSLLRVLDLEGTLIDSVPEVIGDFIHLRFLSLRRTGASGLLRCIWKCKYLETLDLRTGKSLTLSNELQKLERLRHLYFPSSAELLNPAEKLSLTPNQLRQMETLKNFDLENFKTEGLKEMTVLRKFSIVKSNLLKEKAILGHILESPLIGNKSLGIHLHLNIKSDLINEKSDLDLEPIVSLGIVGRIELSTERSYDQIFVQHLTRLYLESCEIRQEGISVLEGLPHLKELRLNRKAVRDRKMSFSNGGFLQLAKLYLCELDVEEWEVGRGALPNLRCLFICLCRRLTKIPRGLHSSVWIYCRDRIDGMERYKTCPYPEAAADQSW